MNEHERHIGWKIEGDEVVLDSPSREGEVLFLKFSSIAIYKQPLQVGCRRVRPNARLDKVREAWLEIPKEGGYPHRLQ